MILRKAIAMLGIAAILPISMPAAAQDPEVQAQRRMKIMDSDGDGSVSLAEFTEFRRGWTAKRDDAEIQMKPDVVKRAFGKLDVDGNQAITYAEVLESTKRMKPRK